MDLSRYLDMFLEESREHLQNLNEKILELEENPEDRVIVDGIFRSAHTLKGMSATMGFNQIAELTHQMENLLHKVRNGERTVTPEVIDLFFKCLDTLEGLVNSVAEGEEVSSNTEELVKLLQQAQSGEVPPPVEIKTTPTDGAAVQISDLEMELNAYDHNLIAEANERGFCTWQINIRIKAACVMKSARSYMVFRNLEELGEIIKTMPSVQDIEEEKFDNSFQLLLVTEHNRDEILKAIEAIAELEPPEINQVDPSQFKLSATVSTTPSGAESTNTQSASGTDSAANNSLAVPVTNNIASAKDQAPKGDASKPAAIKHKAVPTIRVDIERLDSLMNLVGELVINKGRLAQIGSANGLPDLNETLEQLDRISTDLQNLVMKVRMVPIEQVFSRFPRMVRDLAKDLGKEIDFIVEGKETELDRTVIDEIGDPLVHLLRNSIDHGIESAADRAAAGKSEVAVVRLVAKHEGNKVVIEVEDDGKGINSQIIKNKAVEKGLITQAEAQSMDESQAVHLVMAAGLSTADKITDVSGRGVGLDAVRSKIESLSGEIHIETKVGGGTKFKIHLPLTLAIIQALIVQVDQESYAIPLSFVDETTCITGEHIKVVEDQEVMVVRGKVLPLVRLHNLVELPLPEYAPDQELFVVVVRKGGKQAGILVDELIGQHEIVIKTLGHLLDTIPGLAGANILGDGHVSLILDVSTLF